jgi:hypothetical protein
MQSGKSNQRIKGPLSTDEIERQKTFWVKRVQNQHADLDKFKEDELRLNLKSWKRHTESPYMEALDSPWLKFAKLFGYLA